MCLVYNLIYDFKLIQAFDREASLAHKKEQKDRSETPPFSYLGIKICN